MENHFHIEIGAIHIGLREIPPPTGNSVDITIRDNDGREGGSVLLNRKEAHDLYVALAALKTLGHLEERD